MNKIIDITKFNYKYVILFSWMLFIFLLSNEPSGVSSGRSDMIVYAISSTLHLTLSQEIVTFLVRKSAHIAAYFILGILIYNIIKDYKKLSFKSKAIYSSLFVLLYAVTDEIHQLFVQGRSCELRDVLIDFIAGFIGIMVYIGINKFINNYFIKIK